MINIQNEVQKIHNQYGMSEVANYKIQLLCEQYAKEYNKLENIKSFCNCDKPIYNYPEIVWCDRCRKEILKK